MRYSGLTQQQTTNLRAGGPDAFGNTAEPAISSGAGTPCRHCLRTIPKDAPYLIFAHKPFETTQPYSEIGPIFLCSDECAAPDGTLPEVLTASPDYLVKAYSADERIIYGTGAITAGAQIAGYTETLFDREEVAFVDVRSAKNNCWITRITRD